MLHATGLAQHIAGEHLIRVVCNLGMGEGKQGLDADIYLVHSLPIL